jgi:uncharacterized protein YdhG (YjbR/CyaY superfamily)
MEIRKINKYKNIDDYIGSFPHNIKVKLQKLREIIKQAAPEAEEVISYNMPAFKQKGILAYFAAYAGHIGFYPTSSGIAAFKDELKKYETSKGTIRFPHDKDIPGKLVTKIVKFKVKEILAKKR